jgi:hypothetical protein
VGGLPGILLTAPDEPDDQDAEGYWRQLGGYGIVEYSYVMEGINIALPSLIESQTISKLKTGSNQRIYQSILPSFSLMVPGGVLRFINRATMAMTPALRGRFM